jgi:hypothetical protein
MTVYIVGNPAVRTDSLPSTLVPYLQDYNLVVIDPTESFIPEEGSVIIDTVLGLDEVKLFRNLDDFSLSPQVSVHDYDLLLHLRLLRKLGKIRRVAVIGIPPHAKAAPRKVNELLADIRYHPDLT